MKNVDLFFPVVHIIHIMWLVARFPGEEIIIKLERGSINFVPSYRKFESRHALAIYVPGTSKWEKEIDKLSRCIKCVRKIDSLV